MRNIIGKPVNQDNKFFDRHGNPIHLGDRLRITMVGTYYYTVIGMEKDGKGKPNSDTLQLRAESGGYDTWDDINAFKQYYEVVQK